MTVKAVALDMDGLMFDTEDLYWQAASTLLGRRGHEYTEELNGKIMGRPPRYCFELFIETFSLPETWLELQDESEELFLEYLKDGSSPMPGLSVLLDYLERRDIPKAICTSSARRLALAVLQKHGVLDRFRFVLTSADIQNGKPDPEIYTKAAARFSIDPADMLVLEDSEAGSRAARAAGAYPVAVLSHHNGGQNFESAQKIVNSLDAPEILELFG